MNERTYLDCREMPSESNCSLTIIGTAEEVLRAGIEHAVTSHGHQNDAGLADALRGMLKTVPAGGLS